MKKKYVVEIEADKGRYWVLGNGYLGCFDPDEGDWSNDTMGVSITEIKEEKEMISGIDKVKLSAPWYTLLHEYVELFKGDKDVDVVWRYDAMRLDIRVHDSVKADALMQLLPNEYKFGDIVVEVRVVPSNSTKSKMDLFCKAFEGNRAVSRIVTTQDSSKWMFEGNYIVFNREVVQFYNDNLADINGSQSMLYEDIAREIFKSNADGIYFCTEGEPE